VECTDLTFYGLCAKCSQSPHAQPTVDDHELPHES
jgi:hypothetical protein